MIKSIKFIFFISLWFFSLYAAYSIQETFFRHELHQAKRTAFNDGVLKAKKVIHDAPYISNSLLASKSIGFQVIDTYFAKGSILRGYLYDVADKEGLSNSYTSGPNMYIFIDGNSKGVLVNMIMKRDAYLDVSFEWYNVYKEDIFILDTITSFSLQKWFPPETQYDQVASWLEVELKTLCTAIKEKNAEISDAIHKQKNAFMKEND